MTSSVDKATQTQIANIQARTGKTLDALYGLIAESGLSKHSAIRDMLIESLGLGYGDANALAHFYRAQAAGGAPQEQDPVEALYSGSKAGLRPLHDALMAQVEALGPLEIAPKKTYLSLRRRRQFAMLGPGTRGRLELGLNLKELEATERLIAQPAGGMCQYKVYLNTPDEIDAELLGWLRLAYEAAG